ncbi:hypothetical protein ABY45_14480 [Microbacterium maritypicum]|uniref:hypothetical protein n=1 Tax=Microbacterium maritypicum TaxID=33918 RepID=UPI003D6EFD28
MDFKWTWEAIGTFAAIVVSLIAIGVAVRANRLVGVYRRPLLVVSAGHDPEHPTIPRIRIDNRGASPAQNVQLVLDADPLHHWVNGEVIPLITPGNFETVQVILPPNPHSSDLASNWFHYFAKKGARQGRVYWTDLEGRRRYASVMVPAEWKPSSD